jgi:dienelactone hydrolase
VHGGLTTLVPGALAADPFRDIARWQKLTGGRVQRVTFTALDGAQLHGHLWLPPRSMPAPRGGYPGVVITDGSVQAYENLYYWAAEGLAQYGYEVLTFDVQGQGDSDLFPADCTPSGCPGVPYQQSYNFYQGTEDALNWFLSAHNPGRRLLDANRVGLAGHSLGASAVSWVAQCDRRVRTVVAWDDLIPISMKQCAANVTIPARYRATRLHAPALATTNDYEFNVQPATTVPNPHGDANTGGLAGDAGYQSLAHAGIDTELVSFRNGTHLTYTYIDYVLPSNQLSERFAFHYTLAWFDRYLRAGRDPYTSRSAYERLTTLGRYDSSADRNSRGAVSIGAGLYDPQRAAGDVTDNAAGNVPYLISGLPVRNSLSFYYLSQYHVHDSAGRLRTCTDMYAGCPRAR